MALWNKMNYWFKSYLTNKIPCISTDGILSDILKVNLEFHNEDGTPFLLCSLPYLLSLCPINLPVSLCGNFFLSKVNLFLELQRSAVQSWPWYLNLNISGDWVPVESLESNQNHEKYLILEKALLEDQRQRGWV